MVSKNVNRLLSVIVIALTIVAFIALAVNFWPGINEQRFIKFKPIVVLGGSMSPAIKMGSVVLIESVDAHDIKVGDIIVFPTPQGKGLTTHRVDKIDIKSGSPLFRTKGDANRTPDNWSVSTRNVLGKVITVIPYIGYPIHLIRTPAGYILFLVIPIVLLLASEIRSIIANKKRIEQGNEHY